MAPGFGGAGFAGTGMVCAEVVWAGDDDDAAPVRVARSRRPVLTSCTTTATAMLTMMATTSSRSEEHTSELQSLMRISYAVFCLKKKKKTITPTKRRSNS